MDHTTIPKVMLSILLVIIGVTFGPIAVLTFGCIIVLVAWCYHWLVHCKQTKTGMWSE